MRNKFLGTGEPGYHPLRKIKIVVLGLRFAVRYDFSVAYKLVLSTILLGVALVFQEWVDFEMILLATGLVVMAELFNSAIEAVCDFMETRQNEKVRAIKDIAAAAVGLSIATWLVVVVSDLFRVAKLIWPGLGVLVLLLLQFAFIFAPFFQGVFGSSPIELNDLWLATLVGASVLPLISIEKWWRACAT